MPQIGPYRGPRHLKSAGYLALAASLLRFYISAKDLLIYLSMKAAGLAACSHKVSFHGALAPETNRKAGDYQGGRAP